MAANLNRLQIKPVMRPNFPPRSFMSEFKTFMRSFQQIQEMFTSGLIEESEASAWARRALGMEDPER
jgi:hypothetical protein